MGMSVRQHLTALHDRMNHHHIKKAASHATRATHFKKLANHLGKTETTEASKDSKAIFEALAGLHEEMSQEHSDMAAFHADSQEKCSKALDTADLNKLIPTNVSIVAPNRPTITPVLRPGMQPIGDRAVAPELSKMLALDPEDQHVEE